MPTPNSLPKRAGVLRTVRIVAWGLLGVGGRRLEEGSPSLSPLQILIAALAFMLVFVLALVTVAITVSSR